MGLFGAVGSYLLYRSFAATPSTAGQSTLVTSRRMVDKNGQLLINETKQVTATDKAVRVVGGVPIGDLPRQTDAIVEDTRPEKSVLKKYIITLTKPSLAKRADELKKQRAAPAAIDREISSHKATLRNDRQAAKDKIGKRLDKSIVGKGNLKTEDRKVIYEFDTALNAIVVELAPLEAEKIKNLEGISRVEEDTKVTAQLNQSVPLTKADSLWPLVGPNNNPLTGRGIKIGVIDTGVDYTHPDLGGCFGSSCKVAGGYDFVNKDNNPMDDHGHGTHVAATAAGSGTAADGTKLIGVAPDATIYAYKVLDQTGGGNSTEIIAAINTCIDPNGDGNFTDHLDVCSMSIGGGGTPDDAMSLASDNAMLNGVVITIAAGNDGPGPKTIDSPGTSREAITVGASCKPTDISVNTLCPGSIANFSSRGPVEWTDLAGKAASIIKPDVVAPGVNICAAEFQSWYSDKRCHGSKHIAIDGTSMATPHVAGVAALLKQAVPGATPQDVKAALKNSAIPYTGFTEPTQGKGLVDSFKSVSFLAPGLDLSSKITTTPALWQVQSNYTHATYTTQSTFTLKNTTATSTNVTVGNEGLPAGYTLTSDKSSFSLPANSSTTVAFTLTINNAIAVGNKREFIVISFNSSLKNQKLPLSVTMPSKVTLEDVDFGVDPPTNTSTWSVTKNIKITNKVPFTATYTLNTDCCYSADGGPKITGAGLALSASTITLAAGETKTIAATMSINNSLVPNDFYKGSILASSPVQTPTTSAVKVTKFFALKVSWPSTAKSPWVVSWHNQKDAGDGIGADSLNGFPGNSVAFYYDTFRPTLDITARWDDLKYAQSGETQKSLVTYVVKEGHAFTGNDEVVLDPATAINIIDPQYVGIKGERLDKALTGGESHNNDVLTINHKATGMPAAYATSNIPMPSQARVNNISSNYLVNARHQVTYNPSAPDTEIRKRVNWDMSIDNGVSTNKMLTNTKTGLRYVPYYAHKYTNSDTINIDSWVCNPSTVINGGYGCSGFSTERNSVTHSQNKYRLDAYVMPSTTSVLSKGETKEQIFEHKMFSSGYVPEFVMTPYIKYTANGFEQAVDNFWGNYTQVRTTNTRRLDLGVVPFNYSVSIYNTASQNSIRTPRDYYDCFRTQDSQSIHRFGGDPTINYRLLKNGTVIKQDKFDCYTGRIFSGVELGSVINNQPGTYDIELSPTVPLFGIASQHIYKSTFTIPAGGITDSNYSQFLPPIFSDVRYLVSGMASDVIDTKYANQLIFKAISPAAGVGATIKSTTAVVKTDVTPVQNIPLTQNAAGEYVANIGKISGATNYEFTLTATDSNNNKVTYTFKLPVGSIVGPIDPTAPQPPANLRTSLVAYNKVDLAWDASPSLDITHYAVYRGTQLIGSPVGRDTTTFSDTTVTASTTNTYTVKAYKDSVGNSSEGISLQVITPAAPTGPGRFVALSPARIADTRSSSPIAPNQTQGIQVAGLGGVPASGVSAVVLNITEVSATATTYLSVFASGATKPSTSNLNANAGQIVNNEVITKIGLEGKVNIYNNAGYTHVIVDVLGYYGGRGDNYVPITPTRLADTRAGEGKAYAGQTLGANGSLTMQVSGRSGIPANATSVVAQVTMPVPASNGYEVLYPSTASKPATSNLNYVAGQTITKEVHLKLGTSGAITIFNGSLGANNIIIDVLGYHIPDNQPETALAKKYIPLPPTRLADTRLTASAIGPNGEMRINAKGQGGIPTGGVSALVVNITVPIASTNTYLNAYPGANGIPARPLTSVLSYTPGMIAFNQVTVKLDANSVFSISNYTGSADAIVDVVGYYFHPNANPSSYTNACPVNTNVESSNVESTVIYTCIARGSSTSVAPIKCPANYYTEAITAQCKYVSNS